MNSRDGGGRPRAASPRIVVSVARACLDATRRKRFPLGQPFSARLDPLSPSAGHPGQSIMQFPDFQTVPFQTVPFVPSTSPLGSDVFTAPGMPGGKDAVVVAAAVAPRSRRRLVAGADSDEEDDLGDEEDLAVSQPLADEESSFDDFDDEFDDDFEEEESDPDWDHPDDADIDEPPPAKPPGGRK